MTRASRGRCSRFGELAPPFAGMAVGVDVVINAPLGHHRRHRTAPRQDNREGYSFDRPFEIGDSPPRPREVARERDADSRPEHAHSRSPERVPGFKSFYRP